MESTTTFTSGRPLLGSFKNFAASQRSEAEKVRAGRARVDKEVKLAELKRFAAEFKLQTPTPNDLLSFTYVPKEGEAASSTVSHHKLTGESGDSPGELDDNLDPPQSINSAAAPSTIGSSSFISALTRGTRETRSTAPTSTSDLFSHDDPRKQPGIGWGALEDIQEGEEEDVVQEVHGVAVPEPGEADGFDGHSLASQGSTVYTPEQRNDMVSRMTGAILRELQRNSSYHAVNDSSREHILPHLQSALKDFAETAEVDPSIQIQGKALRMVRRLRPQITSQLHTSVLGLAESADTQRTPIRIGEDVDKMELRDIITRWGATNPGLLGGSETQLEPTVNQDHTLWYPEIRAASAPASSVSVRTWSIPDSSLPDEDTTNVYGASVDPSSVLQHFTSQPSFRNLVRKTEALFEQYHSNKMDLIRLRTSLAIRRQAAKPSGDVPPSSLVRAVFHVGWDLKSFLISNYDNGVYQELDRILAITGDTDKAQLCSVGRYLKQWWPSCSSELLQAIGAVLPTPNPNNSVLSRDRAEGSVVTDQEIKVFSVEGTEGFVISIAQQISWLAAACQEKQAERTYGYVGFSELDEATSTQLSVPSFRIDVNLERAPSGSSGHCWNSLVGPAVIITGFPIPERDLGEQGLEISVPDMAALARIPQAVSFNGGMVFKGRCRALVPTVSLGPSTQWHLIDTSPKKLDWSQIDETCRTRLRGLPRQDVFWDRRSFLGWCAIASNLLATPTYNYKAIQYSNAGRPSRWAQADKLAVGFSQWATLQAEVTVGKRDGFQRQRAEDYETLLQDASDTHVILHDTACRRAYQTNAEDLILHMLHHRRGLNPPSPQQLGGPGKPTPTISFTHPDRRVRTTREVMLENADRAFSTPRSLSDGKPGLKCFVEEVEMLWSTIDGVWAHTYASSEGKHPLWKFDLNFGQAICGWEYMDLMNKSRHMDAKAVQLSKTCGRWNDYAKDIKAVVLFGAQFGDVLTPIQPNTACPMVSSVPRDSCYLAVPVRTVEQLFDRQGASQSQTRLTSSGLALKASERVFHACNPGPQAHNLDCSSEHLVHLVSQGKFRKPRERIALDKYQDGAIIIGGTGGGVLLRRY